MYCIYKRHANLVSPKLLRLASFLFYFYLVFSIQNNNNSIVNDLIIGTCGRVITNAINSGDKVYKR